MNRIIITNISCRKAFDIISILTFSFKDESFILRSDKSIGAIKARICYGSHIYERLDTDSIDHFAHCMNLLAEKYADDRLIYVPVEEQTTDLFVEYISIHGKRNFVYLLPDKDLYRIFRNKLSLNELCLKQGFPAPRMYNVSQLEDAEYPILLKPSIGSGSQGLIRLYNKNELTDSVRRKLTGTDYLAQELLPNGRDVKGAFFLCRNGEVVGAYTHNRIRTIPEEGGVTVLSKIDNFNRLLSQGSALLKHFKWNGLIMLEYLYDPRTDEWKLIEANPRVWGSIMLAEYGGAFLLTNYVRLCLKQDIKPNHINKDTYIRWLFPMDCILLLRKRFNIKGFWTFKNQCFINWTYARKDRAIAYLLFSIISIKNLKKLLSR